jgi:hypothetical protein
LLHPYSEQSPQLMTSRDFAHILTGHMRQNA